MNRPGLSAQAMVVLLIVALVRGPAHASPLTPDVLPLVTHAAGTRIAVVAVGLDKKSRAQLGMLEQIGEETVQLAGKGDLVSVADAYEPNQASIRSSQAQDAANKMKDGQKFLDDLDTQKATEAFVAAQRALVETDFSRTFEQYAQAIRMKAASHAAGGENAPAKQEMERLIALQPTAPFPPNLFSPDLIKFGEAAKKVAQAAKGEMTIKTSPTGARVYVDGSYKGLAPVTVSGLPAGKHFVTAVLGGYGLTQVELPLGDQTVELRSSELTAAQAKAEDQIAKYLDGQPRDAALMQLGRKMGVDQLLVFIVKKGLGDQLELIGMRLDVRDGHNYAYATSSFKPGEDKTLGPFADDLMAKEASRSGKQVVTHYKGGAPASGLFTPQRIAGISLVGFGVLSLGSGIVFGVQALNNATLFRATPQVRSVVSNNLALTGRTFSIVADISYLVAIAAAAVGAVLFFTGGPKVDADEVGPAPRSTGSGSAKKNDEDKAAEQRRRDEEKKRREEDNRRAAEEQQRRREEEKKAADKKAEEDRKAEEERKAKEEADKKEEEKKAKQLTKKEREEEERKKREEEKKAKEDEKKKKADEERQRKEDEKKAKEEERLRKEEEKKKKEEEDKAKKDDSKKSKKEREAEEKKKKEDEEKAKAEAEEKARREAEEKRKKEDEDRKRAEEEKRKAEEKKKAEEEDDLRNH